MRLFVFSMILGIIPTITTPSFSAGVEEMNSSAREIVAVVNGEEIFLDELNEAVAAWHSILEKEEAPPAQMGYTGALDRLINTRLIIQEAVDVGLYERPGFIEKIQRYKDQTLASLLKRSQYSGIEPDKEEIERIYQDEIRRWKFRAISFKDLEQAQAFRSEINEGGDFDSIGEEYVRKDMAFWEGDEREVREAEVAPQISAGFIGKEVGSVTRIIQAVDRFFIFQLTGVNYPDDPAARKKAVRKALSSKREKALQKYIDRLIEKYVSVNQEVLEDIGREGSPDIEKDSRVVAEMTGEDPVHVMDLFRYLQGKAYHGGKDSEHREAIESDPGSVLTNALEKRLYLKEARETGVDKTDLYMGMVADYENSLLFGMYMDEFLIPLAQVSQDEVRSVYEGRSHELLLPQKIVVNVLSFNDEKSAEKALKDINKGADIKWLGENAVGLDETGVALEELVPETLEPEQKNLFTGVNQGDTGLYKADDEIFKVFLVKDVPPRGKEPFESARPRIARELFEKNMDQSIKGLAEELRELSEITIYEEKLDQGPIRQDRIDQ